jgi:2-phospho-L-lactate/phosphoenolpyruvate guanylyltransferase
MPDVATPEVSWSIIVPVKRLATAKTRLAVPPTVRAELALAMALDTVAAALDCPRVAAVVAVSDDADATQLLAALGAVVVRDEPDAGLNPALAHGAAYAVVRWPGWAVAALASDLPALRPSALGSALDAAATVRRGAVADAAGSGTTLLTARVVGDFSPAFGPDSWHRHVAGGAHDLTATAGESLRRDVDTLEDLLAAGALGCGPRTTDAVRRHGDVLARPPA